MASLAASNLLAKRKVLEVTTPHFVIFTDAGKGDGKKIATEFELMRQAVETFMSQYNTEFGKPIWILALHDVKALQQAIPEEERRRIYEGARTAAKYLPGLERDYLLTSLTSSKNRFELVYWGYMQALNRHSFFNLPGWANTGLAQFFKTIDIQSKRINIGQPSIDMINVLRRDGLEPLEEIISDDPHYNSPDPDRHLHRTAQAWLIVHYLLVGDEQNPQRLQRYLGLLDQGAPESAARNALGSFEELRKKLEWYFRQNRYHYWSAESKLAADPDTFTIRELDEADEEAIRALYLVRQNRPQEAHPVVMTALRQHPHRPLLLEARGLAAYDLREQDEAREAFESLVAIEPDNALANFYLGRIYMERSDQREKARRHLMACVESWPDFAPAYSSLAHLPRTLEETEEGLQFARKAAELEPVNPSYLLTLGQMLLRAGHIESAFQIARRLSQIQDPGFQGAVRRFMDETLKAKNAQDQ